jgi:hypothetical protein
LRDFLEKNKPKKLSEVELAENKERERLEKLMNEKTLFNFLEIRGANAEYVHDANNFPIIDVDDRKI